VQEAAKKKSIKANVKYGSTSAAGAGKGTSRLHRKDGIHKDIEELGKRMNVKDTIIEMRGRKPVINQAEAAMELELTVTPGGDQANKLTKSATPCPCVVFSSSG